MRVEDCPVCGKKGKVIRELPGEFLAARLSEYYNEKFPDSIRVPNYRLRRCLTCTLEYADPLVPGGLDFYDWITRKDRYYPDRWEWEKTLRLMEGDLRDGTDVLEVGCGSGEFLRRLRKFRGVKFLGLTSHLPRSKFAGVMVLKFTAVPLKDWRMSRAFGGGVLIILWPFTVWSICRTLNDL